MDMPACRNRAKTGRRGFTLVEIMLTLAVLAVAFTALLSVRARSIRGIRGTEQSAVAQGLAERILAERISSPEQTAGEGRGFIDGYPGFSYHVAIRELARPVAESQSKKPQQEGETKGKPRLYEISVTVTYKDFGRERTFSLGTLLYDQPALRATKDEPQ